MTDTDPTFDELAARLAAGEAVDPEAIPERLRQHPDVLRLLALSRVLCQLDANVGSAEAAPEAMSAAAPDRLGPFRLVRVLGTGGMGEVWLGERDDGEVEQRVAVKRVRNNNVRFAERLREERRILARLEHPNIAHFIDAGLDAAGTPWLAMEYVDGVPITDWCQQHALGLEARLRLFIKVCAAVEHAHRHLVVHRDLKPSNILVSTEGEPKLLDFGIAKLLDTTVAEATQTALTPAYAAPEQLRGGAISTATDVYALGLVLFRLLSGTLPETRTGENLAQVLARLDDEETERPSRRAARNDRPLPYPAGALAGDLDAIVAQALRAEPARRYGSPAALAEDIARHLDARPVLARAPTRWYRAGRFIRRHSLAVGFASLAAVALVAGTAVALDQAARARAAAAVAENEALRADREAELARAQAQRARAASGFVLSVFQQADLMRRDARGAITLDEAFEDALARIDSEFENQPMIAADLNDDFGEILASRGRFEEAELRFRRALVLAENAHGPHSAVVAESLVNLSAVMAYRGQPLEGKPYIERAVAILAAHAEEEPLALANARMSLANVRMQEGRAEEAIAEMSAAVDLSRTHLPAGDQRLPVMLFNLGAVEFSVGRFADAQPHFDKAISLAEELQGADSAALIPLLDFAMSNLDALGRHAEGAATAGRLLALAEASFPDAHPQKASALMGVGYHALRTDDAPRGRQTLDAGIAMARALGSPVEVQGWRLLARALAAAEDWPELAAAAREGSQRCTALGQATRSRCFEIEALGLLAALRLGIEPPDLARVDALDAAIREAEAGGDAPLVALELRAEVLLAAGRHAQGLEALRELSERLGQRYPAEHRDRIAVEARRAAFADR
ncbi:MAG: serine/threonine-protein kinase [Aquimonas sp.]|nr:serine/threonine-protein kinase [Aquimonas sp.]